MNQHYTHLLFVLSGLCWLLNSPVAHAEGTKEVAPTADDIVMLLIGDPTYGNFAVYDGPETSRLYFSIKDAGETVYLGLSRAFRANGRPESTGSYYFRIRRASDGSVVHGPYNIHAFNENVSTWADAALGPAAITGQGYETNDERYRFQPNVAGEYFIEFEDVTHIGYWDITVASGNQIQDGRVYSRNWSFRTPAENNELPECVWDREFNGALYSYTSDGFVSRIDFADSGFQGLSFNVAFNRTGPGNTGDFQIDRMSVEGQNLTENAAEHLIFLNEPDPMLFPDGDCGMVAVAATFYCSGPDGYCIEASVTEAGQVELLLDFNKNGHFDEAIDVRLLHIFNEDDPLTHCISWDGRKGDGSRAAYGETVDMIVQYTQGVQHWALFDGEFLKNGFCVEPVRPICELDQDTNVLYWDDRNLSGEPGTDQPKNGLSGCDCSANKCRNWDNFSSNTTNCSFINDAITDGYGDKNTLNTWWFARFTVNTVSSIPIPGASINGEREVCQTESVPLRLISSTTDLISVRWEGPQGFVLEGGPQLTEIYVSNPGEYRVIVVDAFGCTSTATHQLSVIDCPTDVSLDKSADLLSPAVGDQVNFSIRLTNDGPSVATGIKVEDQLPDGLINITNISHGGTTLSHRIRWNNIRLEAGETIVLTYSAVLGLGYNFTNLAEVTDMDQGDVDSTPGNGVDTNGNDVVSDDPGDEDDGDGVVLQPIPCDLEAAIFNIRCQDNGTPTDPSDDMFTFEVQVDATSASPAWRATDAASRSGVYGQAVTFGPYLIANGAVQFEIRDQFFGAACSVPVQVDPPSACSNTCQIEAQLGAVRCHDGGTPSDPADDTYTFDLHVDGQNTGNRWQSGGNSYAYNTIQTFGPYLISEGSSRVIITDVDDASCRTELIVQAPPSCSGQCSITAQVANVFCDDNGTPSLAADDVYFFDLRVDGSNVSDNGWTSPLGIEGPYQTWLTLGPVPISNGNFELLIRDRDDASCTVIKQIVAPPACSDQCLIEAVADNVICNDSGTPSDPSDDTYTFEVMVSGLNTSSAWQSGGNTYTYDVPIVFGPYLISAGATELQIADTADPNCTTSIRVDAPPTCSDVCRITYETANIVCDDNGTPSHADDDVFYFDLRVSGANTSAAGWLSPIGLEGTYDTWLTFGPYPISDGKLMFTIWDKEVVGCATMAFIDPPTTCSDQCLLGANVTAVRCEDNGTPSDPTDDVYYFDMIVSGLNTSDNWMADNGLNGVYNTSLTYGPFPISGGDIELVLQDSNDPSCDFTVNIAAPAACSDQCAIEARIVQTYCDDNGTSSDPADDVFYAEVMVSGANTSPDGYHLGDQFGVYGTLLTLGPYPIADGEVQLVAMDTADPFCQANVTLTPPASTCSEDCEINISIEQVECHDNGTADNPTDDVFTVSVIVTGFNHSDTWVTANGASGAYDQLVVLGPFAINEGEINLRISDQEQPDCRTSVRVSAPESCSPVCRISQVAVSQLQCADNGTPTDPNDDTFTFQVTAEGYNLSAEGWVTNLGQAGAYQVPVSFGPYLIADGDLNLNIRDREDSACRMTIDIAAPPSCSEQCAITAQISQVTCLDNGTPSHAEDDQYTFAVAVTPINQAGAGWVSDEGYSGNYDEVVVFGPYPISEGVRTITITSQDDQQCQTQLQVQPPPTCSDLCFIEAVVLEVNCRDQGTIDDPSDDTFTYELEVNGLNTGDGWSADDGTVGSYNSPTLSVAHAYSEGDLMIQITDQVDNNCTTTVNISRPTIIIDCPENNPTARRMRTVQVLSASLDSDDSMMTGTDQMCWLPADAIEPGNHYLDLTTLQFNSEQASPQAFSFYLYSTMTGPVSQLMPEGVDGTGSLYVGAYHPVDPCCYLQAPTATYRPTDTGQVIEGPTLHAGNLMGPEYKLVTAFTQVLAPNQVYTILTTSLLQENTGSYVWVILSDRGAMLEVVSGEGQQQVKTIPVEQSLTFFDQDLIMNNTASTELLGSPVLSDYCGIESVTFTDQVTDLGQCEEITVTRQFDVIGNGGEVLEKCAQKLSFSPLELSNIFLPPQSMTFDCEGDYATLSNGLPHPSVSGYPFVLTLDGYVPLIETYEYNITLAYKDNYIDVPGATVQTYQREWTIIDNCSQDTARQYLQMIKIGGTTDPVIDCPLSEHYCPILEENIMLFPMDPFACTATVTAPPPEIANTCGEQNWLVRTEFLQISGADTVVLATFEPGEEPILSGLEAGDYAFRYTVFNNQGNAAQKVCIFRVADLQEPVAVCRQRLNLSLNNFGGERLYVQQINQGSYDNCGIDRIELRRVFQRDPDTCDTLLTPTYSEWGDYVEFYCCDANLLVVVEMRITDINGLVNTCWTHVLVEDKRLPVCTGLRDTEVSCADIPSDFDPADTTQLRQLFGFPVVIDNCIAHAIELEPDLDVDDCGRGTIVRRFRAVDVAGNESATIYTQVITITDYLDYEIGFPADAVTDCTNWSDTLLLRRTGCDSISVRYEDEWLAPIGDECYRLSRTIHVINHCEWNGVDPPVAISRDEDCNGTEGEERVWVLRRPTEAFVDRDTNEVNNIPAAGVKGNGCGSGPNPAGYWRTVNSTGYWTYRQEIRVFDEQPPLLSFIEPEPFCADSISCEAEISYPFRADDLCVLDSLTRIELQLDQNADGSIDADLTDQQLIEGTYPYYRIVGHFPLGQHEFLLTIEDACGNRTTDRLPFSVVDCYVPDPICQSGLIVNLAPLTPQVDIDGDGDLDKASVRIFAGELASCRQTDCSPPLRFSLNRPGELPDIERTFIDLTCDERYSDTLDIYVWDGADNPYQIQVDGSIGGPNYKHCRAFVLIQDPAKLCPGKTTDPNGGGASDTEADDSLPSVELEEDGPVVLPIGELGFLPDSGNAVPGEMKLYQNRPNPFAQSTVISFDLPGYSRTLLQVRDVSGRVIWQQTADYEAGYHEVRLEASDLSGSGLYYYFLQTDYGVKSNKLILSR